MSMAKRMNVSRACPQDRRSEPRFRAPFPVWWRSGSNQTACQAWMLDVSAHGAALLTTQEARPAIGDPISLSLVSPDTSLDPKVSRTLLDDAKVLRTDALEPSLERVALRFNSELWKQEQSHILGELAQLFDTSSSDPTRA